LGEDVEVYLEE
jgi:hypothetical protein